MKLLVFKAYFEPEIASSISSTNNLLEDFASIGWNVDLHVPIPTRGVSKEVHNEYKQKKHEELYGGKVKVYRFYMFREGRSAYQRTLRYFCSCVVYFYKGLLSKDIDVIYAGSTPPIMGILAATLKKIKKVPFVYSLQDIFPDSLVSAGLAEKESLLWKTGRMIENYTYKNTDKIIVISEDLKQNLIEKGVPVDKIEVIYNWVDENAVVPIERNENTLFDKMGLSRDFFYVVYAGNLGYAQNIDVILKTAKELSDYPQIKFVIFGGGQQEKYYKDMVKTMNLSNIIFFPLQHYSMVSEVYSFGDVSFVTCKAGTGESAMPSKTWSIMSAGTAVIANFDENTDLHRIIDENGVGIFTKADDIEGLKNAILKLYDNKEMCESMGKNGRDFIINNLTREIGTKKYINAIKSVVGDNHV